MSEKICQNKIVKRDERERERKIGFIQNKSTIPQVTAFFLLVPSVCIEPDGVCWSRQLLEY